MPYKNKEKKKAKEAQYYQEHRKLKIEYAKLYRESHKERHKKLAHLWYEKNKEKIKAQTKKYRQSNKEHLNKLNRKRRLVLKIEVLKHYANGNLACVICNEKRLPCLTIDHIEGGGRKHRQMINGLTIYYWLKLQGFPSGYQVLCMNCQFLKQWGDIE